jgi:hypothetical protein
MTKDEAFTAEQLAKGLVLHQGKWMTPEEQMEAKGFVMFEGMWVTPAERDQVLAQRREQQRLAAARAEAERQRVVRDAEQRRREQARIEQLKVDAYTMSQDFMKRKLKAPASAQFQPFKSSEVTVVFADGWYLVSAPVDAQNSFGAMLRNNYLCKLRPVGNGDKWEADLCEIQN